MKLYLSYLAVRDRETGETGFLAQASHLSGGGDVALVAAAHETIRGPSEEGAALRGKYSHALFVVDNQERAAYAFPDPVDEKRKRLELELSLAKQATAEADRAAKNAKVAADVAKAAARGKTDASDRVKELEKQLASLQPEPKKGGATVGVLADLLKLDDAQLAEAGKAHNLEQKKGQTREDFAREIAKAAGYKVD